ncbi:MULTISPECIES: HTH-type transcriptional activator RhaS [unclassified Gilliamella]|uniref:HTH-type transcriptional activator RhaS n=1 Tax=unclassified Gilliamella TaxID=2685620 RepID=UPI00226A00BD|nr:MULTISPECIES: HTH-type transcriptional activator RhaS [unclassified Gilliamella]MCX8664726.1 HTH-type transcriptional activator RhaS [Gilliamella sp. B2887]MCX8697321.1 HTH-type transcriptional activator RhaS [Gilliamella sp. B3000]
MIKKLLDKDFFVSSDQNIALEPRAPQTVYPEHTHNFNEIVIVTKGSGKHILNGQLFDLYPGMMFYIHASDCHLYENVNNLHLTNILFRDQDKFNFINGINELIPRQKTNQSHYFVDKKCNQYVQAILNQLNQMNKQPNAFQESLFLQLLLLFKQNHHVNQGEGSTDSRVKQLLHWLQIHFNEPIDWDMITQQFSLSLRSFHRHIKNHLGITPQKYLIKLRLAEAYTQLIYTRKTITEIAQECGFNDSAYFSTCFKQEFEIGPQILRNDPERRYH